MRSKNFPEILVLEKLEEEISMKKFLSILLYYLFSSSI
ncbi:hypothetical protein J5U22_00439 [Saccharolobus shibatae]|uniref:Uncharacterized protein n=1 Tax=Saccharolobus shibatae TaxID=2286 RepID=A0A8F5BSW9_9CREN|nr:hypothetical protein J5U21_00508 [Saccharolobus shibatae]QXJ33894.1 hypothetical protein J5U22_00439 [Saccharolobus shibatae]